MVSFRQRRGKGKESVPANLEMMLIVRVPELPFTIDLDEPEVLLALFELLHEIRL